MFTTLSRLGKRDRASNQHLLGVGLREGGERSGLRAMAVKLRCLLSQKTHGVSHPNWYFGIKFDYGQIIR